MPGWLLRALQAAQALLLVLVLAWALSAAAAVVRRHWPLRAQEPPRGSYVAVTSEAAGDGRIWLILQSMAREISADIRLGG